jgi:hypothetical protein
MIKILDKEVDSTVVLRDANHKKQEILQERNKFREKTLHFFVKLKTALKKISQFNMINSYNINANHKSVHKIVEPFLIILMKVKSIMKIVIIQLLAVYFALHKS